MPRYEYQCGACGTAFEATHKMSDPPVTTCPSCGKEGQVQRLLSAGSGLIFKGSGFYITDYKNSNASSSTPSTSKGSDSTPSTSSPSGDSGSAPACGAGACPACTD